MVHSIKNLQSLYYTVTQVKQSLSQYITRQDFGGKLGLIERAHGPHGKLGLRTGQSQRREVCM
jgi:hypothetical protein